MLQMRFLPRHAHDSWQNCRGRPSLNVDGPVSTRLSKTPLSIAMPYRTLRPPDQFSHWTDVVSLMRNELFLARELVAEQRKPWESACRARTPEQVHREIGILARLCEPRDYCAGWPSGRSRCHVATYKLVFKGSQSPPKGAKERSPKRSTVAKAT